MDCSLPGSFIHGILQARVLEWGAIAFSRHIRLLNGKFMIIRGAYKKELGVGEEERNRKHLGPIQQNALRKQWRKQKNDLTSPVK